MTVVQADGNNVVPVTVEEFRIGPAETYDVIVEPGNRPAYTIFAQAQDRTGYARATLAVRNGATAAVPPMDPRPIRTMADMGMGGTSNMPMGAAPMSDATKPAEDGMNGMAIDKKNQDAGPLAQVTRGSVEVDNVAANPVERLGDPGVGLTDNGRRVLTYRDLCALKPASDTRLPSREIVLHLTGNMGRYMWGFDGKKYSEAPEPIGLQLGERVRFVLINDTMMEHPIHLHGLWSELENGQGEYRPYKHTVIVKGGERLSYLVTANTAGKWAYHCHLFYHLDAGMLRVVAVG